MSFENGVFLPAEPLEATGGPTSQRQRSQQYFSPRSSRGRGGGQARYNNNLSPPTPKPPKGDGARQKPHKERDRETHTNNSPHTNPNRRDTANTFESNPHQSKSKNKPKPPRLMEMNSFSSSSASQPQERQQDVGTSSPIGHWGSLNPDAPVFQPGRFNIGRDNTDAEPSFNRRGHSNRNQNQRDSRENGGRRDDHDTSRNAYSGGRDRETNGSHRPSYNNRRPNYYDGADVQEENDYEEGSSDYNNDTQQQRPNWTRKPTSERSNNWRSEIDKRGDSSNGFNRKGGSHHQNFRDNKREPQISKTTSDYSQEDDYLEVQKSTKPDIRNQRETLIDQLARNAYDCMICVEKIRRTQPTWACQKCYNVFHFGCTTKWASASVDDVGWRCPGCQSYCDVIPTEYRCFCGATKNPHGIRTDVPHCCGQTCARKAIGGINCIHSCPIACHPGPCPPCEAIETRYCCCGKTSAQVKCSSKAVLTCGGCCDKALNCGFHKCKSPCHSGPCDPCSVKIQLECYCRSEKKEVVCTEETSGTKNYCCAKQCEKPLNCNHHTCSEQCHPGLCKPCKMSPQAVISCPCGQTPIAEACLKKKISIRKSCLDPIPTCGKTCAKILPCGIRGESHTCRAECHLAPKCPTCLLTTSVKCRCGNKNFEIPCEKFNPSSDVLCEKKCTKKRSCGRHKCNTKCCIDPDHICPIVCDRSLRCGSHKCALLCHNGHCPPCRIVSFEELSCECGASIIYPPVSCGTKPPPCHLPCPRTHPCDHPVLHNCHSEAECPPCTVLTSKWCNGKHELRKNVMCYIQQVSCGMPCKKLLPCGRHKCIRACHPDTCLKAGEICKLPCEIAKADCGHICAAPCHDGPCAEGRCKQTTEVSCECGRKKETMICWKREKEYDRLVTYLTNLELKRLRNVDPTSAEKEPEINEAAIFASMKEKTPKSNVLECDKECARVERNRKMVEALQLEDPDVTSTFGTPNYSDFLSTFAKKNPQFVENVHERLTNLVVKAQRSKRKNETYGFESMNRDKRHFVHEYSDHFGCLSESYDEEPNRSVVCTAAKDKSYLPSVNLIDAVFRPNLCSERKNAFNDVEIFQNSKSQIMRPANGKIVAPSRSSSGMVALMGPSGALPNGDFPPLS